MSTTQRTGIGSAACAALLALACGATSSGPQLGDPCKTANDCPSAQNTACIAGWPGGYCTEGPCTLGSCPQGATCAPGIFPGLELNACFKTCRSDADCRTDYACVDVSQPQKICTLR